MAANIQFVDYATSVILGALGPATTTIQLQGGTGALFPAAGAGLYFYASLGDVETGGLNQHEVVRVTNKAGDTLTVVRGGIIDGTPQAWAAGSLIEVRPCAQAFTDVANLVAGGAPTTSPYVLAVSDPSLPNRRILTGSSSISVVDGGPANPITLSVPVNGIANAQLAQMPANTIKGNNTGVLANAADLTALQVAALIGAITSTGGVVSISAGLAAARPAAGVAGRVWLATDTGEISRDTGAVWFLLEPALTGDVTNVAGSLATTIAANAVTNAKLAQMAPATIKGNPLGSLANPQDMTGAQLTGLISTFGPAGGSHSRGVVPDPGSTAGLNRYLRDDATFALPSIYTFNVIDYGADPTGAADSTAAVSNAFNAIPATGGVLYFPAGVYKITATITLNKPVTVLGDGWGISTIGNASSTLDTFIITAAARITNLRFFPIVARTAGTELKVQGAAQLVSIDEVTFVSCFNPISVLGSAGQVMISRCTARLTTATTGIGIIFNTTGAANTVCYVTMDAAAGSQPQAGIMVTNAADLQIIACDLIHCGNALVFNPGNGQAATAVYCSETFFDNSLVGLLVQPSGTGAVIRNNFVGCWFGSSTQQGIHIIAGGATIVDGNDFIDAHIILNGSNGAQIEAGVKNTRFLGGEVAQNTGDGLQFNTSDFCVIGVRSGTTAGLTANTGWGVNVNVNNADRFTVTGNDLNGNTLGAFQNLSTQTNWISGQNLGDTGMFTFRGKSLVADFSAAGAARATLQTSVLNGNTLVLARPNGTNQIGAIGAVNSSDMAGPATLFQMRATSADNQISVTAINGGGAFPIKVVMNGPVISQWTTAGLFLVGPTLPTDDGISALQINGSINIQTGPNIFRADFSGPITSRTVFQTNNAAPNTTLSVIPGGAGGGTPAVQVINNANLAGPFGFGDIRCGAGAVQIFSGQVNGGTVPTVRLVPNGIIAIECDILGNTAHRKAISDQGYSLQTPLTGFAIVIPDGCSQLALNPGGVLATGTITMPAAPIDGQYVNICTTQTVTALTLNANAGQTISGNVTTLTATTPAAYRYFASITRWMKVSS
jgi:hypothetical protein